MDCPPDAGPRPSDFRVGDRVEFIRDWDPGRAADDPLYEPPVPGGAVGRITDVGEDHVRVRLEDPSLWPTPVVVWQAGRFPDAVGGSMACLRRLADP